MNRTTVRNKFVAVAAKGIVVSMGALSAAGLIGGVALFDRQVRRTSERIRADLVAKGLTLVVDNGHALRRMVEEDAVLAVRELVAATVAEDPDAVAGLFMDRDRRPLAAATDSSPAGDEPRSEPLSDSISLWAASIAAPSFRTSGHGAGETMEFAAAVKSQGERVGTIRYTLSTRRMHRAIREAHRDWLGIVVVESVIWLLVAAAFLTYGIRSSARKADEITRPVRELADAAATIAKGNYQQPVTVVSDDEVGALARDFEAMRRKVKEYAEDLEKKVADRTARLNEAMAELERSNKELEQFAYVASHDLNEPLRMVTSYLGLLQRRYAKSLDADAHEFIGFAVDGAVRMRRLIEDLLMYSRVGTRGKPFAPVNLDEVLAQVLKNLEVAVADKGGEITHDPLPTVTADHGQMAQLLQNLIANALKFCKDRPPRIHVEARRSDEGWEVGVRDNGIGIAPEHFERIFQIFQRLHTRQEYEGTGIGLAVCKRIVERHAGTIGVESQVGVGTTFRFVVPDRPVTA